LKIGILGTKVKTIQITSKNFILLAKETPSFTSIHYKDKNLKPVFDERTSKLLFEYYLLRIFINYIDLSEEEGMITKEKPIEMQIDDLFTVEYLNDKERKVNYTVDQYEEKDLVLLRGNVKQLKQKSAKILSCFTKMIQSYKETIDISYQDIQDRIFKLKEKEKNMITDRLEFNVTDEEREADTILKINKLGVWSKGLEKGLRSYVKENYDKEKEFMDTMMEYEKKVGSSSKKTNLEDFEENKDDYLEQIQQEEEIDREAYDMSHMTEDYMDGNEYEGYEVEAEDYGDYN
jgi:HPt (histidine-containing phosphotransfer) domain-containing protein